MSREMCSWFVVLGVVLGADPMILMGGRGLAAQKPPQVIEETVRIAGPLPGLHLGLRHAAASAGGPMVLFLHGSSVPVSANPNFPFGGRSLLTSLAEQGFDVWGLDFYGFGSSDRYPAMAAPPGAHPPLGPAHEAAVQVDSAIAFLRRRNGGARVMLVGNSGGSLVAGLYATTRPDVLSALVLFAPVTPFTGGPSPQDTIPAYDLVTPRTLWDLFTSWTPAGEPPALDSTEYPKWAATYLASDPDSRTRMPASVRVPAGRSADLAQVASGHFTYDPRAIRAPTLIVIGEWDAVATYPGAQWLLQSLRAAPAARLTVIGRATHTMQYETQRNQVYSVLADFLREYRPARQ